MRSVTYALIGLGLCAPGAVGPLAGQHGHGADSTAAGGHRPYAGLEGREIKALSAEEIEGLEAGEGLGMALAAELNGYAGPKHVLELADALELGDAQRAAVREIRDRMREEAIALGRRIVAGERALDRAFTAGSLEEAELRRRTREIGHLRGELRGVHLAAHLETAAVLTEAQRTRYLHLRGYGDHGGSSHEDQRDSRT